VLKALAMTVFEEWGTGYGWQVLTQQAMTGTNAEKILQIVK